MFQGDIIDVYGSRLEHPFVGVTLMNDDGVTCAVGGGVFFKDAICAFGTVLPESTVSPRALLRQIDGWLTDLRGLGAHEIWAIRDDTKSTSTRMLNHLGFQIEVNDRLMPMTILDISIKMRQEAWRYVGG
ncbi:MAG: hypothetical protein KDI55_00395 [Anaerolineae bacterium]|nr:hypothetical protein [Anaerolineae bacterium]